jgi:hypothetical protein
MPSRTPASRPRGTADTAHLACEPCSQGHRAPCTQPERQHKPERGQARPSTRRVPRVQRRSRAAWAPSRISRLYGAAASDMTKGQSIEGDRGTRLQADAAAMQAGAAAPRVPSRQCMKLQTSEAWTEPLAVPRTQGSTGGGTACQACFLSEEQRKPAEPRQRQAQPMHVHATQARYTSAPHPIAGPPHIIKVPDQRRSMPDTWSPRSPCSSSLCSD